MRMEDAEGGLSRFGALSNVLFAMSDRWEEFTPPYILLLIRTFLTLEGVAGQVDPTFNIYESALPWAIQRAISPSTPEGAATLRSTFLTDDNKVQWLRFEQLIEEATAEAKGSSEEDAVLSPRQSQRIGSVTAFDSFATVMGSSEGAPLRRIARDLDSPALMLKLASPSSRKLRRLAVGAIASAITKEEQTVDEAAAAWPLSEAGSALKQRRFMRLTAVLNVLLRSHAQRFVTGGWRGVAAMGALVWLTLRIGVTGVAVGIFQNMRALTSKLLVWK